jgi:RNA polymerase-interacting CarD/CdnL/TRCF family regulator
MEAVQEMARVDGGRGRRERLWASLLTGQALAAAKVICRLKALRKRSRLTFTDRRILRRATIPLASEVGLVKDIACEQTECRVERPATS